jgi:hypothetical protein
MPKIWEKFLVFRRDGSVPEWPYIVMGGRDPFTPYAVRAYARAAANGTPDNHADPEYVKSLYALADLMDAYRTEHGEGDPAAPKHRHDDVDLIQHWEQMRSDDSGTVQKGQ